MTDSDTPRTAAGQRLLKEWTLLRWDHPPNTAKVRDTILAIEAEASADGWNRANEAARNAEAEAVQPVAEGHPDDEPDIEGIESGVLEEAWLAEAKRYHDAYEAYMARRLAAQQEDR